MGGVAMKRGAVEKSNKLLVQAQKFFEAGDYDAAESAVNKVLKKNSDHENALYIQGSIQIEKQNNFQAIKLLKKVLQLNKNHFKAMQHLGIALGYAGKHQEAIQYLNQSLVINPNNHMVNFNLGNIYLDTKQYEKAIEFYAKVISAYPDYDEAYSNTGVALSRLERVNEAIQAHKKALDINKNPRSYLNLLSLLKMHQRDASYVLAKEIIDNKVSGGACVYAFPLLFEAFEWELINKVKDDILLQLKNRNILNNIREDNLLNLSVLDCIEPKLKLEIHELWAEEFGKHVEGYKKYMLPEEGNGKIRIGYVSPDFNKHAVGHFIRNIISSHDKNYFDIFCYMTSDFQDEFTDEIKASSDMFTNVEGGSAINFEELARQIHKDHIHILVDLAGHTSNTGLGAFFYKTSPVQISYLGYPNTSGMKQMDFHITDDFAEAEGGTLYTEELLKMPESFLCFGSFADRPIDVIPAFERRGHITFAAFNHIRKLNPEIIRVWSEILKQVPDSILVLKGSRVSIEGVQNNIYKEFSRHGIDRERLDFRGFTGLKVTYLDFYNQVDMALDAYPYNGTTTTCEALWMGVPVITLVGKEHAQRVSYSILKNIGIEDTITFSEEEYIEKAVELATNSNMLRELRKRIPDAIRNSILCNPEKFTRQLEDLYRQAWVKKGYVLPVIDSVNSDLINDEENNTQFTQLMDAKNYLETGMVNEAEKIVQEVLAQDPDHLEALFLSGTIEKEKGDHERAVEILSRVVKRNPEFLNARLNLGAALMESRSFDEAEVQFKKVLDKEPDNFIALNNMGNVCKETNRLDEAQNLVEKAIEINPDYWISSFTLGTILSSKEEYTDAINCFKHTVDMCNKPIAHVALITALYKNNNFLEAYEQSLEAMSLPNPDIAVISACGVFLTLCDWDRLYAHINQYIDCAKNKKMDNFLLRTTLMRLNAIQDIGRDDIYEIHRLWGKREEQTCKTFIEHGNTFSNVDRLRIGYLSPDFRNHSVGLFIQNIIKQHDVNSFEIHCYSNTDEEDNLTLGIMNSAHSFHSIKDMNDKELANKIHNDGIHILIDLAGHTNDSRASVLCYRPAPVQITYLGYPNTTGLSSVDYRITDDLAEEEGGTLYTEELLKMPESFLCFGSFKDRPIESVLPVERNGYITFASFNDIRKLNPDTVKIWSEILRSVPESKLIIKATKTGLKFVQENIHKEFNKHGISKERIDFRGFINTIENHLDFYNQIDIALDTYPYNGTTTTCEALWMGVPVVTLTGKMHAQRVSYSILKNIGIEDTITFSEAEYIEKAVTLATDRHLLQSLRARIPDAIRNSILCNAEKFTQQLENLYHQAWVRKGYILPEIMAQDTVQSGKKNISLDSLVSVIMEGGTIVCVPNDLGLSTPYILLEQENWFESEYNFVQKMLQPGMNVIDIGAGYGIYTLMAGKKIQKEGNVWVFESSGTMVNCLAKSLEENNLQNVEIIKSGLSDKQAQEEQRHYFSIDSGAKEHQWKNIDFVKIEVEKNIIDDGKEFFISNSPLVMFNINKGNNWKIDLVEQFSSLEYRSYRYIQGLNLLVPFNTGDYIDKFQRNLFFCKSDRAELLEKQGLLIQNPLSLEEVGAPQAGKWIEYLQQFPYAIQLLKVWLTYIESSSNSKTWILHQHALDYYALAHDENETVQNKYGYLMCAYHILLDLLKKNGNFSNIQSFIRVACEVGEREKAIGACDYLLSQQEAGLPITFDEPFLPVSFDYEMINPEEKMTDWIKASIVVQYEKTHAFSSYFSDKKSLERLESLKETGFSNCEMERRKQLIKLRFHLQQEPEASVFEGTDCNLNDWFWSGEKQS